VSALDTTPQNPNLLIGSKFVFSIKKTPSVNYFAQKVRLPGLTIEPASQANPFVKIPKPGDHIDYDPLTVTFNVDEDLTNYMEILTWLIGMGFPKNFDQYKTLAAQSIVSGGGLVSDISVVLMKSSNVPNYEFLFEDAFPTGISELEPDVTSETVTYLPVTATFAYKLFNVNKI
jgi:hypothetical protein